MTRPIVEAQKLSKVYGSLPVLRSIDLDIEKGQFVALLGANGSGKTTLLRLLSGLTKPTSGVLYIGGWEFPKEAAAVRAQIGIVGHQLLLYPALSARENLRFFARLYNLSGREAEARIDALIERVGLGLRADDTVRTFSRGMGQRLSIARALLHNPHILLLDEPYTGLDQDASAMLDSLLQEAHADGHTIIMITHGLDRAARLANRAVILSRGKIALDIPTAGMDERLLAAQYAAALQTAEGIRG